MNADDSLAGLTDAQRAAVSHVDGPMLVLAGPGSGKTRVITRRIAHLVSLGLPPREILAVTFTNKAAEEMRTRLKDMGVPAGAAICTFHALGLRLLREFAGRAGLSPSFSIWDQAEQKSVVRAILQDFKLDPQQHSPGGVLRWISASKNASASPGRADAPPPPHGLSPETAGRIFAAYQARLTGAQALDFDDLLEKTAALLAGDAELRERLERRWTHVLVDEYQDTNACQYRIARELVRGRRNLFVTGDPDQSIYAWRGADIGNILAFEKDFPEARVVRLEENFRSSPQVLKLADALIRENTRRKDKGLIARRPDGPPPRLDRYADEHDEALGTAAWLRARREEDALDYGRMAVFYRTNAMSRVLEEALIRSGIPYRIVKGLEFFDRREVKDLLAYLKVLVNPADEISLLRILNRPARGLGEAAVERLSAAARAGGRSLWTAVADAGSVPGLPAAARPRLEKFAALIEDLRALLDRPAAEIARAVYERTGLRAAHEAEKDAEARENVEELIHSAVDFDVERSAPGGLDEYLQQIALVSDADAYDERSGAVSLMTLHTAKGLEFQAVAIVGVEDSLIPHARSTEDGRDLEEERRLLFVGITRAERFLVLSHVLARTVFGSARPARLSPFLRDIEGLEAPPPLPDEELYPFGRPAAGGFPRRSKGLYRAGSARSEAAPLPPWAPSEQAKAAAKPKEAAIGPAVPAGIPYRIGQRVKHPAIGPGRVEAVVTDGQSVRVVVQFDKGPRVALGLKAALLEPID